MKHTYTKEAITSSIRFWLAVALAGSVPAFCVAHSRAVHEEITTSSALSSSGLLSFLSDTLGAQYAPFTTSPNIWFSNPDVSSPQSPVNWIRWGAYHEDDRWRFGDHFYTVTPSRVRGQVSGLTDGSETLGLLPLPIANSYRWATEPGILEPDIGYASQLNSKNWPSARDYQYLALTESDPADREANMAHMLYALGHVIHLNQDLSQPEHVRNDEHPFRHAIEVFGRNDYRNQPNAFPLVAVEQRGWAWWQAQGFEKLLDFWDRGKHIGGSSAGLDADAHGDECQKLGLAEFSNGNFLGQDASYAEYFKPGNKHYFPFPSIKDTDQSQLKLGRLAGTLDTTTLRNGKQGQRSYLKKLGAGRTIVHHSAVKYLAVKNSPKMGGPGMKASLTINETNVLQDYHSILIPKAIEYSAGILDYFFRGRLEVATVSSSTPGKAGLRIKNVSGAKFLNGRSTSFGTTLFIDQATAQYYFEQTIDGQLLLFPVDFVKENGVWRILEY